MNQTEQYLINKAIEITDQAMNDEPTYNLLKIYFDDHQNESNWKMPTKTVFSDYTGNIQAIEGLIDRVIWTIAAYIFYTGGAEINLRKLYIDQAGSEIEVSTKGYYHYIGA